MNSGIEMKTPRTIQFGEFLFRDDIAVDPNVLWAQ